MHKRNFVNAAAMLRQWCSNIDETIPRTNGQPISWRTLLSSFSWRTTIVSMNVDFARRASDPYSRTISSANGSILVCLPWISQTEMDLSCFARCAMSADIVEWVMIIWGALASAGGLVAPSYGIYVAIKEKQEHKQ